MRIQFIGSGDAFGSDDMLARRDAVGIETAEDGKIVKL